MQRLMVILLLASGRHECSLIANLCIQMLIQLGICRRREVWTGRLAMFGFVAAVLGEVRFFTGLCVGSLPCSPFMAPGAVKLCVFADLVLGNLPLLPVHGNLPLRSCVRGRMRTRGSNARLVQQSVYQGRVERAQPCKFNDMSRWSMRPSWVKCGRVAGLYVAGLYVALALLCRVKLQESAV